MARIRRVHPSSAEETDASDPAEAMASLRLGDHTPLLDCLNVAVAGETGFSLSLESDLRGVNVVPLGLRGETAAAEAAAAAAFFKEETCSSTSSSSRYVAIRSIATFVCMSWTIQDGMTFSGALSRCQYEC